MKRWLILFALFLNQQVWAGSNYGLASMGAFIQGAQQEQARENSIAAQQLQNQLLEQQLLQQKMEADELQNKIAAQHRQQQINDQFWAAVSQKYPDWQNTYNNYNFKLWLENKDSLTNIQRHAYLDDAIQHSDVDRVVAIFTEWRDQKSAPPVLKKVVATTDMDYFIKLTKLEPSWRNINNDPHFKQWVMSLDPKTGIAIQIYLEDAQKNRDVTQTTSILDAYLSTLPTLPDYIKKNVPPSSVGLPIFWSVGASPLTYDVFYTRLYELVPDYKKIENTAGFNSWLLHKDPNTGYFRQYALDEAFSDGDISKVAGIFNNWKKQVHWKTRKP